MTRIELLAATIAVLLIVWLAGVLLSRTAGGTLHLIPAVCVGLALAALMRRRAGEPPR